MIREYGILLSSKLEGPEKVCQPNSRRMVHTVEKSIRSECLKDVEYVVERDSALGYGICRR